MTCDDVFDILTRGPFPSGAANDEQVEQHLARCGECRRLATALRPAVELFQEAIEPDETAGLPGYRGRVAMPGADDVLQHCEELSGDEFKGLSEAGWRPAWIRADAAARRYGARPAPKSALSKVRGEPPASFVNRVTRARTNLFRFAAAVIIGVAAAAGARPLMTYQATSAGIPPGPPTAIAQGATAGDPQSDKHDLNWLASLSLPATCQVSTDERPHAKQVRDLHGIQLASAVATAGFVCCSDCHNATRAGLLPVGGQAVVMRACTACHQ